MLLVAPTPTPKPDGPIYLPETVTGSAWLFDPKAGDALLPRDWIPSSRRLDRHAVAADLRALPGLFEQSYAWAHRNTAPGELEALMERHARRVERRADEHPTIAAHDAFAPVYRDLFARYDEQHMWFNVKRVGNTVDETLRTNEYRGPADALAAASQLPGAIAVTASQIPRVGPRGGISTIGSVSVRGTEARDQLAGLGYQSVADAVEGAKLIDPRNEPVYSWRMVGDTAVVRLTSFSDDPAALRQFVADAPKHRQAASNVLDFRGNGGGNDGYMRDWAQQLRSHRTTLPTYDGGGFRSGLAAMAGIWNMATQYEAMQPGAPGIDHLRRSADESKQHWPLSASTPMPPDQAGEDRGTSRANYRGKVVVLVDRTNASSGESAALMAREWLDATIVGERTGGAIEGANVLTFPLPNSGVTVSVPGMQHTFDDPAIKESAGIPIDVALARPGAPVEELIPQLKPWLED